MRFFEEERMNWVKETIEVFGTINRFHVVRKFGVSTQTASRDLSNAQKRWPDLIHYDKSEKRFVTKVDGREPVDGEE